MADTALPGLTEASSLAAGDLLFASVGGNGRKITYENVRAPVYWGGTAGGTANALTLTPSPAITAYAAGQRFTLLTGSATNTSTVTLAVSGLSAQAVKIYGRACRKGDLRPDTIYEVIYDGSEFHVIGEIVPAVLDPFRFGAKGDGSTDDVGYLNDALSFIRENVLSISGSAYFLDCKGAHFKIEANSLAANAIVEARMWGIRNAIFDGWCSGLPILDLAGSRDAFISNVFLYGRQSASPSSGMFWARVDGGTNAAGKSYGQALKCVANKVDSFGYFLDAALHLRSAEEGHFVSCNFENWRDGDGSGESWAAIFDGNGSKTTAGDSENETPYSSGRSSFTMNAFDRCSFKKATNNGPSVYITDMASAQFNAPYITCNSGSAIVIECNSSYNPYSLHFNGLQIETASGGSSVANAVEFDGVSGNPDCVINDLRMNFSTSMADTAHIKLSNFGSGSLTLKGADMSIPYWLGGGVANTKPTAVISRGSSGLHYTGRFAMPNFSDMDPATAFSSITGEVLGYLDGIRRNYGGIDNRTGGIFDAFGHYQSGATALIADDATEVIDLTADGINADGMFMVGSTAANITAGIDYHAVASAIATPMWTGSLVNIVTNTDLSAASLPVNAGQITIAINEDEIQILNERGFAVNVNWFIFARGT